MSLEAAIEELNGNIKKLVEQNEKIMGMAAKRIEEAGADKPKTTRSTKAKEDTKGTDDAGGSDASATTKTVLTDAFKAWMGEFGVKPDSHPESAARHALTKTTVAKVLGDGKTFKDLAEDDQESIDKLYNWLETKAKTADKGHGIGRLVADPVAAPEASDDDGLGV